MKPARFALPALLLALVTCGEDRERPVVEPTAPQPAALSHSKSATDSLDAADLSAEGSSACRSLRKERVETRALLAAPQAGAAADAEAASEIQEKARALDAMIADVCN